jgi:hypothetical protein
MRILLILYSCRKKDNRPASITSFSYRSNPPSPPLTPLYNFHHDDDLFSKPPPTIVPRALPTARSLPVGSGWPSERSTNSDSSSDSDEASSSYTAAPRRPSAAETSLLQLKNFAAKPRQRLSMPPPSKSLSSASTSPTGLTYQHHHSSSSNIYSPERRPQFFRSSTSNYTEPPSPNVTTPSTPVNSSMRPLPPRFNPQQHSASPRSIELITPVYAEDKSFFLPRTTSSSQKSPTTTSTSTDGLTTPVGTNEQGLMYEKKWTLPSAGPSSSSLKQLFNFNEMRGAGAEQRPSHLRMMSSPGRKVESQSSQFKSPVAVTVVGNGGRAWGRY